MTIIARDPVQQRLLDKRRLGYMWRRHIQCCSAGPLVYVRNLKCGSTFFWNNFTRTWGWSEIAWENIDWKNQRVFGHIMDPLRRRVKGIAEYLHMTDFAHDFENNQKFQNFVLGIPSLDIHSSSYHDQFGNLAWHIDWIPVHGHDNTSVITLTEKLLSHWGLETLDRWNYGWTHNSTKEKKHTEDVINQLVSVSFQSETISWYFHNDIQLWNTVNKKFNAAATRWPEISWLDQPTTTP